MSRQLLDLLIHLGEKRSASIDIPPFAYNPPSMLPLSSKGPELHQRSHARLSALKQTPRCFRPKLADIPSPNWPNLLSPYGTVSKLGVLF